MKEFILIFVVFYVVWSFYCEYYVIKEICSRTKRKYSIGENDDPIHSNVYFYLFWGGPVTWLFTLLLYKFLCVFNKTIKA